LFRGLRETFAVERLGELRELSAILLVKLGAGGGDFVRAGSRRRDREQQQGDEQEACGLRLEA
jgi:hypothetical protein